MHYFMHMDFFLQFCQHEIKHSNLIKSNPILALISPLKKPWISPTANKPMVYL